MPELPLILVSSLPRSGSTLLQNLLAQHPLHHCTSTNSLLDMLSCVRDRWMGSAEFIAQGLRKVEPRIRSLLRAMIQGFYREEFASGKTVFDKSRGWLSQIRLIENVLERPVKVIVTVRDVRDILASFEKIYRQSIISDHPLPPEEAVQRLTVQGRCERLMQSNKTLGYVLASLQGVYESGLADRLVIVPYRELTRSPVSTVKRVCYECGVTPFDCDPSNVEPATAEDDTVYGMYDLHATRKRVEPAEDDTWRGIIPDYYAAHINQLCAFAQDLARGTFLAAARPSVAPASLSV